MGAWVALSKSIWALPANEIGDFFAGFAGALALVWIIATIFLQKEELELQRKEVTRLADEAVFQTQALTANAKSFFMNRWQSGVRSFLIDNHEILNDLARHMGKAKKNSQAVNSQMDVKMKRIESKAVIDRHDVLEMYAHEFRQTPENRIAYTVKGTLNVYVTSGNGPHRIPIEFPVETSQEAVFQDIVNTGIYLEYLRELVREGISHSLDSMMLGYGVYNAVNPSTPSGVDSDLSFMTELIIKTMIECESRDVC